MPRTIVAAATAALVLCTGCVQQPTPSPLPQATPTWSCTPVTGETPYPCYEQQYQETSAQNALYAQAEAVYRKYAAEDLRILWAGGTSAPTSVLLETTAGTYLSEALTEYRQLQEVHGGLLKGGYSIAWFKPVPDVVKSGSVATLEVCKDISDAIFRGTDGKPYQLGEDSEERLYFVMESKVLKVGSAEHKRVNSC